MEFKDRGVQFPGQKKLTKVNPVTGLPTEEAIYVKMERAEGYVTQEGTTLNAENLNKGNWRDDNSVSFTKRNDNNLPIIYTSKTQIITKQNGETWLIPPQGTIPPFQIQPATINNGSGTNESTINPYPVGAIYLSVSSTNPTSLFGGTWEQIKDRFLLATGDNYAALATGGEATHSITTAEMAAHSHGNTATITKTTLPHTHGLQSAANWSTNCNGINQGGTGQMHQIGCVANNNGGESYASMAGNNKNYVQPVAADMTLSVGVTTANSGGSAPHNNMPPYLAVYIWKRID